MEVNNLTKILNSHLKHIGTRQVLRGIKSKEITKVFLANNIDKVLHDNIVELCTTHNIPYEVVCSKEVVGKICKIDVSCACVGVDG